MVNLTIAQELALVEKAKQDIASFESLYELYFIQIFRYCRRRLPNQESAEDVTSTVFLKAIDALKRFDTRKNTRFGSWLYKTAHNTIIDFLKKQKLHLFQDIDDSENLSSLANEPIDPAEKKEQQLRIFTVLTSLNERYQLVLTLKFYEEMENSQIGSIMHYKQNQVSVILYRALKEFRKQYLKKYPTGDIFNLDNRYIK